MNVYNNDNNQDQELYDEFGNYIGPDLESSSDDDDDDDEDDNDNDEDDNKNEDDDASLVSEMQMEVDTMTPQLLNNQDASASLGTAEPSSSIVLHEDKVHYPSATAIYGPQVTTAVLDEDAMDISQPILPPSPQPLDSSGIATATTSHNPFTDCQKVSDSYLISLASSSFSHQTTRGVSIIGNLHSGKTSLVDLLLSSTLYDINAAEPFYLHTTSLERQRLMSLTSTPITMPLCTSRKTYSITFIDNPGHVQFHDESCATLRLVDGAMIVLDVVEGMTMHDEMLMRQCVQEGLAMVLVLNKVDRLITDLKLPLRDAYYKIVRVLEDANGCLRRVSGAGGRYPSFCPTRNVAFGSALHGWVVTLGGMAEMYVDHVNGSVELEDDDGEEDYDHTFARGGSLGKNLTMDEFVKRLWGDCYLDPESKRFRKKASDCNPRNTPRTFCQFVLEPIYKIYTVCLGEKEKDVNKVLRSIGIHLTRDQLRASSSVLLKTALQKFFEGTNGFVEMIVKNIPTPSAAALGKLSRCYTGAMNTRVAKSMMNLDPNGPLMIHVTKLYASHQLRGGGTAGQSFSAFGRIYSGSVKAGDKVKVLGESYSPEDDEDMAFATVEAVCIPRGRFSTEVNIATAGSWVLLEGVDANILKTATITNVKGSTGDDKDIEIFAPLKFSQAGGESVMKLSVEPLNPSELPKMVEGLRRVSKAYPMVRTRVEESGEHVLFGTGELYTDCVMHDLRHLYSDIEVKVADPVVGFRETVAETSTIKCFAETANKRNKLTMIAEPLDEGLAEQLEAGKINLQWDSKKMSRYFQTKFDWDLLSARSVWAFGDSPTHGPNILMDDTLPSEVDKKLLSSCKSGIVQGFQWATREGPLCEEPVRSTKLKLLDTILADKPIYRGAGQIIPTARRVVHSSILTASPRLMEPVYRLEIQCQGDIVDAISPLIKKRRGHIVQDRPVSGTPFYRVKAFLPVIDSFGFETDLRTFTQGQAMVHSVFDHWAIVPGDPLDKNVILHPLEPSPPHCLARDFLIKTRRRKGLSEDVSLVKYFDEGMLDSM
mmetsp:Transcript_13620/g.25573  ORF Transcript_13620/g.25573 Transcript_13620/m.25573 type:complete len:1048 (+) Transcript_13620:126-3269(+)